MVTDPISDMLNRIKTSQARGKEFISVPFSILKYEIAKVLENEGYLAGVEKKGKKVKKTLILNLSYDENNKPRVSDIKRISKPSRRIYKRVSDLNMLQTRSGNMIVSTPKGIVTQKEAIKAGVGGEVLFKIW